jgi:hypothetical protein
MSTETIESNQIDPQTELTSTQDEQALVVPKSNDFSEIMELLKQSQQSTVGFMKQQRQSMEIMAKSVDNVHKMVGELEGEVKKIKNQGETNQKEIFALQQIVQTFAPKNAIKANLPDPDVRIPKSSKKIVTKSQPFGDEEEMIEKSKSSKRKADHQEPGKKINQNPKRQVILAHNIEEANKKLEEAKKNGMLINVHIADSTGHLTPYGKTAMQNKKVVIIK